MCGRAERAPHSLPTTHQWQSPTLYLLPHQPGGNPETKVCRSFVLTHDFLNGGAAAHAAWCGCFFRYAGFSPHIGIPIHKREKGPGADYITARGSFDSAFESVLQHRTLARWLVGWRKSRTAAFKMPPRPASPGRPAPNKKDTAARGTTDKAFVCGRCAALEGGKPTAGQRWPEGRRRRSFAASRAGWLS